MNSALSCSSRSVVSATVWLTRAEACSTLRLKLVMKLPVTMLENTYANGANAQARLLFRARSARSMAGHKKAQPSRADIAKSRLHQTLPLEGFTLRRSYARQPNLPEVVARAGQTQPPQ